jgi:hypothetical protein
MSAEPTSKYRGQKRVPDFFIIGQPKSGTTALYDALRRHPQIYMPGQKEPTFFATDIQPEFQEEWRRPPPQTLDDYLALFGDARSDEVVGEASTAYLWSHEAARAIAGVQPQARLIAIFREPTSFLRSVHLEMVKNHNETEKDLRRALSLEEARRNGKHIPRRCHRPAGLMYSERVRYAEQLRRFHDVFPPEQILVLIYDDFRLDNETTVRKVLRFLEVDDTVQIEMTEANATVRLRSRHLKSTLHAFSVGHGRFSRATKAGVKVVTSRQMRHGLVRAANRKLVFGDAAPVDEKLMLELRRRYRGEVVALSESLSRDLVNLWGYDNLD